MSKKRELQIYIGLAIILTILPLCFYILKFSGNGFSNDITIWSNFATYFTGFTTPILSILNLIVLVRLTLSISNHDNDRMLIQLRYDAYKDIATKLNGLNEENYAIEKVNSVYYYLENYSLNNFFLLNGDNYKILTNIHLELWTIISKIKFSIEGYENSKQNNKYYSTPQYKDKFNKELTDEFIKYDAKKLTMLSFLEKIISNKSIDNFKKYVND